MIINSTKSVLIVTIPLAALVGLAAGPTVARQQVAAVAAVAVVAAEVAAEEEQLSFFQGI